MQTGDPGGDCDEGNERRLWTTGGKLFRCRADIDGPSGTLFSIYYTPEGAESSWLLDLARLLVPLSAYSEPVDPTDSDGNGRPDVVDATAASLLESYQTYDGKTSDGLMSRAPAGPIDVALHETAGAVLPPVLFDPVVQLSNDGPFHYLPRHELFHLFQYEYLDTSDFLLNLSEANWWMEATAEWAAHQVTVGSTGVERDLYLRNLNSYLADPGAGLAQWDGFGGSKRYGAFIVAEYLEERFGRDFIDQTWAETAQVGGRAVEGIDRALQLEGSDWADLLPALHRSEYTLDSIDGAAPLLDPDVPLWRVDLAQDSRTEGDNDPAQVGLGMARPARVVGSPFTAPTTGAAAGSVVLAPGGAAFFDILPGAPGDGEIEVAVVFPTGVTIADVAVQVLPVSVYPSLCAPPIDMELLENAGVFRGTVSIPFEGVTDDVPCSFVSVVITNQSVTERLR